MNLLFIGPLPEPLTGHSLACKVLHDALIRHFHVRALDLSKAGFISGVVSLGRIREVFGVLWGVWRAQSCAQVIYLTISESVAGNLKDLCIYALCYRRLSRTVIHLHGGSIRAYIFDKYRVLAWINRFFLSRIGAVVILGESHREIFGGMVAPERLHVVPNFAEDHLFTTVARIQDKFSNVQQLRILYLGNLIDGKGHEDMVRAYRGLSEDVRRRLHLDFAGAFQGEREKRRFQALIDGEEGITYHGIVGGSVKRELLHRSHVLCLPSSLLEGQPISILEAYASGCVVISTNRGGIPDIFRDQTNGFLVQPGDCESLAGVFTWVVNVAHQLTEMAIRNLHLAEGNHRVASYTGALLDLTRRVASGRA